VIDIGLPLSNLWIKIIFNSLKDLCEKIWLPKEAFVYLWGINK
jgi:hypothetical protein